MIKYLGDVLVLILFLSTMLLYNTPCNATLRYINPTTGVDLGRDGSNINLPIKTLNRAGIVCNSGDTIFIRGGIHTGIKDEFYRLNNQDGWVYIMPYFGESVTLVGYAAIDSLWKAIITIESSNKIYIKGINLINYGSVNEGIGLVVFSNMTNRTSTDIVIDSCITNNTKRQGILIQANRTTVKNCRITNAVLSNQNGISCTWAGALCAFGYPQQLQFCYDIKFINNYIDSCWGEGILLIRTDTFKVQNNKVINCYSQHVYLDNAYNGEVNNNWLFTTTTYFNRHCWNPPSSYSAPAGGIWWAAESNPPYYSAIDRMVENIKIHNNFIYGTSVAFGWFHHNANTYLNNSYRNISIYYNTVYNLTSYECFYIDTFNGQRNPATGCKFINNIIPKGRYQDTIRTYFTSSSDYFDTTKWSFKKNCFIDGYPTGFPTNFYTDNISGNPQFLDTSSTIALNPLNYRIPTTSICNNAGIKINGITSDYWYKIRDSVSPCIGFHEYGGILSGFNSISSDIPKQFSLSQNYPNPFNPKTNIRFGIPTTLNKEKQITKIKIYDILGQEVAVLINDFILPGNYEVSFDGSIFASGIYFYTFQTGEYKESKKMLLIK